jgi:hypothetical protein
MIIMVIMFGILVDWLWIMMLRSKGLLNKAAESSRCLRSSCCKEEGVVGQDYVPISQQVLKNLNHCLDQNNHAPPRVGHEQQSMLAK